MRTAIIYDRVNKWGGAEQVLLVLHELFPKAPLFTSVYNKETARWAESFPEIKTSFLQRIPPARTGHEYFAPLMPIAFESLSSSEGFDEYDLVISVTSEAAKGIITKPETLHICYCLTPTRYLWSGYDQYFKGATFKGLTKPLVGYLRKWDKIAAQRPDHMIAISTAVQERIKKYYNRDSEIIYPPVDISKFKTQKSNNRPSSAKRKTSASFQNNGQEEYYLIVSRLVTYKKVDLAIKAFNELGKKLIVVGTGKELNDLRALAKPNIDLRGFVGDDELIDLYENAKAFINPQNEDFGITSVEAQAAGVPVIAYRNGGALDTVEEKMTGVFFDHQNKKALIDAVKNFEQRKFGKEYIIKRAEMFSKENFKTDMSVYIDKVLKSS